MRQLPSTANPAAPPPSRATPPPRPTPAPPPPPSSRGPVAASAADETRMPALDGPPPSEPTAIWQAVLDVVKARPAMGWVADFRLEQFEAGVARIVPLPRKESRATFASTPRVRASLEAVLTEVLRAPARVEVITPERRSGNAGAGGSPGQGSSTSRLQRAMDLPTVRQLLEVFDVSIVEVRDETPAAAAASDDDPAVPGDSSDADTMADEGVDEPDDR